MTQLVANHWLGNGQEPYLGGGFSIVFITSISAHTASVSRGEYCISKAGLSMARQLWAVRLAESNIKVYEVRPGIMATDMTKGVKEKYDRLLAEGLVPQRRWGTPEDVGAAVVSLIDGNFPFSTGAVIDVDGGFQLRSL
jgi:NAD(P)-dependent dehydrogenase (short-subunit alcohol dehydrogenase family)